MSTLPQRLELTETGEHSMPAIYSVMDTMNIDHDREEWVPDGWQARTYEGIAWYKHEDKAEVQAWLTSKGYKDTGDGAHYERATSDDYPDSIVRVVDSSTRIVESAVDRYNVNVTSGPGEDDRLYDGTDITIYAGAAYTHGRCRHTGIYDIFSGWTKESNNYTAAGLLEIAAYVAEHKEQLEQEAIARREELANE